MTGLGEGCHVAVVIEPAKAVDATLKLFRAIPKDGAYAGVAIKGKPDIKTDAQKLNGFSFHSVAYTVDLDKSVEKLPEEARDQIKQMMQKMIQTDQRVWFGTDGKAFLQVTAKDWSAAAKKLEGDEKSGVEIVVRALEKPVRTIAENSGIDGAVVADEVKAPWYIDLLNLNLGNHDVAEARRRIGMYMDAFHRDGTRITANIDFEQAPRDPEPLPLRRDCEGPIWAPAN